MSIPVLIPTRRRSHLLEQQVKAIREQEGDWEPRYLVNYSHRRPSDGIAILKELGVHYITLCMDVPYQGAETKSYDYDHLATLWNLLLVGVEPPLLLMGSDVLPGEPDTLAQLMHRIIPAFGAKSSFFTQEAITVPVLVNEHGALNWFWMETGSAAAAGGRNAPYRATTSNVRFRDAVVDVARVTGGIIMLNYNPYPLTAGPGSEFYHLKNPSVYLGRSGINIRPGGEEWKVHGTETD